MNPFYLFSWVPLCNCENAFFFLSIDMQCTEVTEKDTHSNIAREENDELLATSLEILQIIRLKHFALHSFLFVSFSSSSFAYCSRCVCFYAEIFSSIRRHSTRSVKQFRFISFVMWLLQYKYVIAHVNYSE